MKVGRYDPDLDLARVIAEQLEELAARGETPPA
jgi:hypothetical protein